MDHLNKTEKALVQDFKQQKEENSSENLEDKETTNGVF
jgi:hypothetical protein